MSNANTDRDLDREAPMPAPERKAGAAVGLVVLLCIAGALLWFAATRDTSRGLLKEREAAFQVPVAQAPVQDKAPPPRPDKPVANPEDQRTRELAERLLLMQQQAEIARLASLQAEQMKLQKAERESRRKRLAADILVYSQGGEAAQGPAGVGDSTDLFASQSGEGAGAGAAGAYGPMPGQQGLYGAAGAQQAAYGAVAGQMAGPAGAGQDWIPAPGETERTGVSSNYAGPPQVTIYQGKIISAVLESRIESEKPGMVRAMVDEDIMSEDGSQILVHKGSRLIGEYRSGVVRGDRRVMVIWQRLIRPDSVSIQLASPGTDQLGVSGLTGDVDSRFLERFGAAILLSFVEGAAQSASDDTSVYLSDAQSSANTALKDTIGLPPRITVDQGSRISVFVARDLDFRRTDA